MSDRKQHIEQLTEKVHSFRRLIAPDNQAACGEECLAPSQWLALLMVKRQEGIGIKELAAQLGISSSAATQIVDGLVAKGFLNRQPSLEDRRALCLSLPEGARQQIEAMEQQRLQKLEAVFSALDDIEFQTFLNLIDKVISCNQLEKR